jgi:hypothetical protein
MKLESRKIKGLIASNVLWHKRMLKHVNSCKEEKYYNTEVLMPFSKTLQN